MAVRVPASSICPFRRLFVLGEVPSRANPKFKETNHIMENTDVGGGREINEEATGRWWSQLGDVVVEPTTQRRGRQ